MPATLESPKLQPKPDIKYVPRVLTILDQGRVFDLHGHVGPWDKDVIDPESGLPRPYRLSEYEFRRCTGAITASSEYGENGKPKPASPQEIDEHYDGLIRRLLTPGKRLRLNDQLKPPEYEAVDGPTAMIEVTHLGIKPDPRQAGVNPPQPHVDPHVAQQELIAEKTAQVLREALSTAGAPAGDGKGGRR